MVIETWAATLYGQPTAGIRVAAVLNGGKGRSGCERAAHEVKVAMESRKSLAAPARSLVAMR